MIFEIPKAWDDRCNHPGESYVGSFECLGEKYDLYIFDCPSLGQSVCIRFGNDDPDYCSPGNLCSFIQNCSCGIEYYRDALELLKKRGFICWKRK